MDLQDVVDRCPAHMTGADLYALCSDAMTAAIKRKVALIDDGEKTDAILLDSVLFVQTIINKFIENHQYQTKWTRVSVSGLDSEDSPVPLCVEDFSAALQNFRPSVSEQELLRYRNIQQRLAAK